MVTSCYEVLGVEATASLSQIRIAFKRRALAVHPDKPGGSKAQFQEVLSSFEALADSMRRARHDRDLAAAAAGMPHAKGPLKCHYNSGSSGEIAKRGSSRATGPKATNEKKRNQQDWPTSNAGLKSSSTQRKSNAVPQPLGKHFQGAKVHRSRDPAAQIFALLQLLCPERRRAVILGKFSEVQRLALEQWMIHHKEREQLRKAAVGASVSRKKLPGHGLSNNVPRSGGNQHSKPEFSECAGSQNNSGCSQFLESHASEKLGFAEKNVLSLPQTVDTPIKEFAGPKRGFHGRVQINGIGSHVRHGQIWYTASVFLGLLHVTSREVSDLAVALDALVVLTSIKQRCTAVVEAKGNSRAGLSSCLGVPKSSSFETALHDAVQAALRDHQVDAEIDLGLRFSIRLPAKRWTGRNLQTPMFRASELDYGLRIWRRLDEARGRAPQGRHACSPDELSSTWKQVRAVFLEALEEMGRGQADGAARLDALALAHKPLQQREMERWNRGRMAREEQRQRSANRFEKRRERWERETMACAERMQRTMIRSERRSERYESHRMGHEDIMARRHEQHEHGQIEAERCIDLWLLKWARRAKRSARAEQRQQAGNQKRNGPKKEKQSPRQQRLKHERRLQKDTLLSEVKRRRVEREERRAKWRRMNNRDLTMAEIMRSPALPLL